jgi:hypothetical protein
MVTVAAALVLVIGCDLLLMEPDPPEKVMPDPPRTYLVTGPYENKTISDDTVTFCVKGNLDTMLIQFRLDSNESIAWSEWRLFEDQACTTLTFLGEGPHTFEARVGNSPTWFDTTGVKRRYIVDAYSSTLCLDPSDTSAMESDQVQLNLEVDTIVDLMAVRAFVIFDPQMVRVDSVVARSSGRDVFFFESRGEHLQLPPEIDNVAGTIDFNAVVSGADTTEEAASGTLARIFLTCLQSGITELTLSPAKTVLLDVHNTQIVPDRLGRARIVIRRP